MLSFPVLRILVALVVVRSVFAKLTIPQSDFVELNASSFLPADRYVEINAQAIRIQDVSLSQLSITWNNLNAKDPRAAAKDVIITNSIITGYFTLGCGNGGDVGSLTLNNVTFLDYFSVYSCRLTANVQPTPFLFFGNILLNNSVDVSSIIVNSFTLTDSQIGVAGYHRLSLMANSSTVTNCRFWGDVSILYARNVTMQHIDNQGTLSFQHSESSLLGRRDWRRGAVVLRNVTVRAAAASAYYYCGVMIGGLTFWGNWYETDILVENCTVAGVKACPYPIVIQGLYENSSVVFRDMTILSQPIAAAALWDTVVASTSVSLDLTSSLGGLAIVSTSPPTLSVRGYNVDGSNSHVTLMVPSNVSIELRAKQPQSSPPRPGVTIRLLYPAFVESSHERIADVIVENFALDARGFASLRFSTMTLINVGAAMGVNDTLALRDLDVTGALKLSLMIGRCVVERNTFHTKLVLTGGTATSVIVSQNTFLGGFWPVDATRHGSLTVEGRWTASSVSIVDNIIPPLNSSKSVPIYMDPDSAIRSSYCIRRNNLTRHPYADPYYKTPFVWVFGPGTLINSTFSIDIEGASQERLAAPGILFESPVTNCTLIASMNFGLTVRPQSLSGRPSLRLRLVWHEAIAGGATVPPTDISKARIAARDLENRTFDSLSLSRVEGFSTVWESAVTPLRIRNITVLGVFGVEPTGLLVIENSTVVQQLRLMALNVPDTHVLLRRVRFIGDTYPTVSYQRGSISIEFYWLNSTLSIVECVIPPIRTSSGLAVNLHPNCGFDRVRFTMQRNVYPNDTQQFYSQTSAKHSQFVLDMVRGGAKDPAIIIFGTFTNTTVVAPLNGGVDISDGTTWPNPRPLNVYLPWMPGVNDSAVVPSIELGQVAIRSGDLANRAFGSIELRAVVDAAGPLTLSNVRVTGSTVLWQQVSDVFVYNSLFGVSLRFDPLLVWPSAQPINVRIRNTVLLGMPDPTCPMTGAVLYFSEKWVNSTVVLTNTTVRSRTGSCAYPVGFVRPVIQNSTFCFEDAANDFGVVPGNPSVTYLGSLAVDQPSFYASSTLAIQSDMLPFTKRVPCPPTVPVVSAITPLSASSADQLFVSDDVIEAPFVVDPASVTNPTAAAFDNCAVPDLLSVTPTATARTPTVSLSVSRSSTASRSPRTSRSVTVPAGHSTLHTPASTEQPTSQAPGVTTTSAPPQDPGTGAPPRDIRTRTLLARTETISLGTENPPLILPPPHAPDRVVDPSLAESVASTVAVAAYGSALTAAMLSPTVGSKVTASARLLQGTRCGAIFEEDEESRTAALDPGPIALLPGGSLTLRILLTGGACGFLVAVAALPPLVVPNLPTTGVVNSLGIAAFGVSLSYFGPNVVAWGITATLAGLGIAAGIVAAAVVVITAACAAVCLASQSAENTELERGISAVGRLRAWWGALHEDCRDPTRRLIRAFTFEDLGAALAIAAVAGVQPSLESFIACVVSQSVMTLVCVGHLAYLWFVRPYSSKVEGHMALANGALLLSLGVLGLVLLILRRGARADSTGGTIAEATAYVSIVVDAFYFVQIVALLVESAREWCNGQHPKAGTGTVDARSDLKLADVAEGAAAPLLATVPEPHVPHRSDGSSSLGVDAVEVHHRANPLQGL
jgi:hypothetical protein